ncbi:MAG TPA: hypothetical protein VHC63_10395 [Acidimicrobiales bacterium]|nr:hypothetical protein [Acidimicrobiales bacterium]
MTGLAFRDDDGATVVSLDGATVAVYRRTEERVAITVGTSPRPVVAAVLDHLVASGVTTLDSASLVLRYEARARGFTGGLRAPLALTGNARPGFLDELDALLPGTHALLRRQSRWRGVVADLVSGVGGMTRVEVAPDDGGAVIVAAVPQRDDLNAEAIALAVDTTMRVRARFGRAVDHVRTLSFDHSAHGMSEGKTAGAAAPMLGVIHLNANFAYASGTDEMNAAIRRRQSEAAGTPTYATGFTAPAPWTPLDVTVAHELWHKIELAWQNERYAESIEFRRAVGELFGHDTIEHVFGDPVAVATLAREVTAYATTNRLEATAEMFEQWWCGPPPPGSIAARFGEIVERFFPPPR